ncbi:MAG: asparagine synthase-related protein [Pseudomonadota bacterium]
MSFIFGQVSFGDAPADRDRFDALLLANHGRCTTAHVIDPTSRTCVAVASATGDGREGPIVAALDGELHERQALTQILQVRSDTPDATLVAAAWARWGHDMWANLLGDFAGLIHDPEHGRATLFRDHIGTRPLYWHWSGARLSVATHLPDLLALLPDRPTPKDAAIAAFLRRPSALTPYTLLTGVQSVRPGHAIIVEPSGPRQVRWWAPENVPEVRFKALEEYGAAFRDLTDRAIADRLRGTGSIGAHLSGGLDSTGVALLSAQQLAQTGRRLVATYSWSPELSSEAPDMGARDERPRILENCAAAGLSHRFGTLNGDAMRRFLTRPLEREGVADLLEELDVLELAKADDVDTLLSGWGGDEGFSAHAESIPAWMLAQGRLRGLFRLGRRQFGLRKAHRIAGFVWSSAIVPLLPDPLFDYFGSTSDLYQDRYISDHLARLSPLPERPGSARSRGDPMHDLRIKIEQQRHIGERMATWASWSAPYRITHRYPLTDRRLITFVLGLPPDVLWGDGQPRYMARAALRGRLRSQLSKFDPANERKRLNAARATWRLLAAEAAAGGFDGTCDWIKMDVLRADLARGPSGNDSKDLMAFIRIFPAMRIWHMAERFGALERPAKRRAAE